MHYKTLKAIEKVIFFEADVPLTQHAGRETATGDRTDLVSLGWGKAAGHTHHPCSAPDERHVLENCHLNLHLVVDQLCSTSSTGLQLCTPPAGYVECELLYVYKTSIALSCVANTLIAVAVGGREMYLGAKCGFFMKIALHEVTVLSGCDFTPGKINKF